MKTKLQVTDGDISVCLETVKTNPFLLDGSERFGTAWKKQQRNEKNLVDI